MSSRSFAPLKKVALPKKEQEVTIPSDGRCALADDTRVRTRRRTKKARILGPVLTAEIGPPLCPLVSWRRPAHCRPDREHRFHGFPTFDWWAATGLPRRARRSRHGADPRRPPKERRRSFPPARA